MQSAGRTNCTNLTQTLVLIPWFESQLFLIWAQVTVLSTTRWQCECYSLKWGQCSNHTEIYKSKSPKWFLGLVLRSLVTQPPKITMKQRWQKFLFLLLFFCKHIKMKHLCIFFQKGKSKPQTVDIFSMKTDFFFFYFTTLLSFQKTNKQNLLKILIFTTSSSIFWLFL